MATWCNYSSTHTTDMAFNITLKIAIVESGKSQIDIAKATAIHESKLSRIVRGHDEPSLEEKKAIAKALRRPVDHLFPEALAS
jgi:transcriptional regulator with XRE-family HTH domain